MLQFLGERTPVAGRRGILQNDSAAEEQKSLLYRAQLAEAVEKFTDADMGSSR